jgi:hypothetical protein
MSLRDDTRPTASQRQDQDQVDSRATSDADLVIDLTTGTAHVPTSLHPDQTTGSTPPAADDSQAPAADRFEILGRTVTLPVHIREAQQWSATWLVPAAAAQQLIDYSGLTVAQPVPGRAMIALAFVRYLDGDLDRYNELAVTVMVRPHDAAPNPGRLALAAEFARGQLGTFVHDLPVDQEFTCAAGNTIWGYPKWIADIEISSQHDRTACVLTSSHGTEVTLTIADSGPLPQPQKMPPTYSFRDGILRRTEWEVKGSGGGARLGGASLVLGRQGPLATALRGLGLPKRALMASATSHLQSTFGPADVVTVRS